MIFGTNKPHKIILQQTIYIEDLTQVVIYIKFVKGTSARFINVIWNDHEYKILFAICTKCYVTFGYVMLFNKTKQIHVPIKEKGA